MCFSCQVDLIDSRSDMLAACVGLKGNKVKVSATVVGCISWKLSVAYSEGMAT